MPSQIQQVARSVQSLGQQAGRVQRTAAEGAQRLRSASARLPRGTGCPEEGRAATSAHAAIASLGRAMEELAAFAPYAQQFAQSLVGATGSGGATVASGAGLSGGAGPGGATATGGTGPGGAQPPEALDSVGAPAPAGPRPPGVPDSVEAPDSAGTPVLPGSRRETGARPGARRPRSWLNVA